VCLGARPASATLARRSSQRLSHLQLELCHGQTDAGLAPNTPYTYTLQARDNTSAARGPWNNFTSPEGAETVWTRSVPPPAPASAIPPLTPTVGSNITWTAVNGFGAGQVEYFRYAWDTSTPTLGLTPKRVVRRHDRPLRRVRGANCTSTPEGTTATTVGQWLLRLLVAAIDPPAITTQPSDQTNNAGTTATFTVSATGTLPLSYHWKKKRFRPV